MKKKKIKIKKEYCAGCTLCQVACAIAHSKSKNPVKAYKEEKMKPYNNFTESGAISFPIICRHCEEPNCITACITGAIEKNDDGEVVINVEKCVGCFSCVMVCPNNAIKQFIDESTGKKFAVKCDLCKNIREIPACVEVCPNKVLSLVEE